MCRARPGPVAYGGAGARWHAGLVGVRRSAGVRRAGRADARAAAGGQVREAERSAMARGADEYAEPPGARQDLRCALACADRVARRSLSRWPPTARKNRPNWRGSRLVHRFSLAKRRPGLPDHQNCQNSPYQVLYHPIYSGL